MLDGASRVPEVVAAAAADGQPALGITDHGNMYGILDFYRACREQGITPVLGTEAYMAATSCKERPVRRGRIYDTGGDAGDEGDKLYYHLTLLATNDSHYTQREDHEAHDALLCVQTGALMADTNRFKFEGDQHYLKSAAEMRDLFRDWPEACDNTLWIAERADVEIEFGKPEL